jgi:crotonobetainyl-CoA:carnitine CoA-transferase CaiB-like acyl-CoA transferase
LHWRSRDASHGQVKHRASDTALSLEGVRIVDFTMGWAGPLCTRTLADLGADVIKIEACRYPDWWRGVDRRPAFLRDKTYEKSVRFAVMNRNKRAITLDLTRPEGLELAKQLIRDADAVVDNYSVDVLPKLGLGADVIRALNPRIVSLSMSAFGASSPYRDLRAYGSTLEQGSGLPQLVGSANDKPVMGHPAFGDPVGGLNGAAALLVALTHARATGVGQHIDLSQIECMMQMTAPWMMAASAGVTEPERYGRGHPDHAPHGVFACKGEDSWVLIAVTDDAHWPAFCRAIERADLAGDAGFTTAQMRRARSADLDVAISAWTAQRKADEAMGILQNYGIAAGSVRAPLELLDDPHLTARGYWQEVDRPYIGPHPQPSMPFRVGSAPWTIRTPASVLGEHNVNVLRDVLGLSPETIAALEAKGIIGTAMVADAPAATSQNLKVG